MLKKYLALLLAGVTGFSLMGASQAQGLPKNPRVLIVYYSLTNNTDALAKNLQAKTGADIFRLETVRTYPSTRPAMTEEPKRELQTGQLPALKQIPNNLGDYDLILVGGPVWWYTVSTPVMRFLQEADFKGKKVAAFCTHGGGIGNYFPHFKNQAKNAAVLKGLEVYASRLQENEATEKRIQEWLTSLGVSAQTATR